MAGKQKTSCRVLIHESIRAVLQIQDVGEEEVLLLIVALFLILQPNQLDAKRQAALTSHESLGSREALWLTGIKREKTIAKLGSREAQTLNVLESA